MLILQKTFKAFQKNKHFMIIQHEEINHKGSFFIKQEDVLLAEMTYSIKDNNIMIINHTEVDDSLKGQKIGYLLVQHGVDFARSNHYKIIPLCSFAKVVFEKKKEDYSDVLH